MLQRGDIITSRANPTVKWLCSLSEKKGRAESKAFITEGVKLMEEAFSAGLPVTQVVIDEKMLDSVIERLDKYSDDEKYRTTELITVSSGVFEKISTEKAPQGVICVIKYLDFFYNIDIIYNEEIFLKNNERAIILCDVRDPSNLGSVIRSSVAFGTEHIILTGSCADIYSPKTVRSAMGSLFRVKVTVAPDTVSLIDVIRKRGRRVLAAELNERALSIDEAALCASDVVVIGNEGHGIPEEISQICNGSVYIPISSRTESLNASVAAAIFMWEQGKR